MPHLALVKAGLSSSDMDYFIAGDIKIRSSVLLSVKAVYPFWEFGACSTLGRHLAGSNACTSGFATNILVIPQSITECRRRQYRYPTEYGYQRPEYAQWTGTGAGAWFWSRECGPGGISYNWKVVDAASGSV